MPELFHRCGQVVAEVASDHQAVTVEAYRALPALEHGGERAQLVVQVPTEMGGPLVPGSGLFDGLAVLVPQPGPGRPVQQVGLGVGVAAGAGYPHVPGAEPVTQPPQQGELPEPARDLVLPRENKGRPGFRHESQRCAGGDLAPAGAVQLP